MQVSLQVPLAHGKFVTDGRGGVVRVSTEAIMTATKRSFDDVAVRSMRCTAELHESKGFTIILVV